VYLHHQALPALDDRASDGEERRAEALRRIRAMATVVLLGTLDTKGVEYGYLRKRIEAAGCDVILIDCGVLDDPLITPDITHHEVAAAAGAKRAALATSGDRGAAVEVMAEGAGIVIGRLLAEGRIHAVLGLGGSGGSSLVSGAVRELPIGFPKLIVSTMASGDTRPYVGGSDIAMMHSVVDIAGINTISKRVFDNAAAATVGMAEAYETSEPDRERKPLIGATMFGVTTPGVTTGRELARGTRLSSPGLPRHRDRWRIDGGIDAGRLHHRRPRHHDDRTRGRAGRGCPLGRSRSSGDSGCSGTPAGRIARCSRHGELWTDGVGPGGVPRP
jgi:hypothetical protein